MNIVYKIADKALWESAEAAGVFTGAEIDVQDGYIHFSTAAQVAETARRHFLNRDDLLLIAIDGDKIDLVWEPSRGGDLFPHLYADLNMDAVIGVIPMSPDSHGIPIPEGGFPA